jgi:hypothetical protein
LMAVLEQNPGVRWTELLGDVDIKPETNADLAPLPEEAQLEASVGAMPEAEPASQGDNGLSSFRL